ncbi:MAG: hypothetical protein H6738_09770 [Alphaproteobacteria bacterium]|nr:hypothetical protein [Alphaproteobacteria bacterium]MCB9697053.1 hypothetical protein [Alphaproteobacteria bacterium]
MVESLVFDLIRETVGALAPGLVLLLALGGALFVMRKSRAAGVLLILGVLDLGFGLLLDIVVPAGLNYAQVGVPMVFTGWSLVRALIRGFGILMMLVAACVGPAPARDEEDY